jgi:cytochrome c oxidase subunit 2
MKIETGNEDFEYVLLCNKICGGAHYNMQLKVIVESEEDYNKWLAEQTVISALNN